MTIRQPNTAAFVVQMQHARYRAWRRQVETFKTVTVGRAMLEHVPEDVWAERFAANEDAYSAVVDELARID